MRQLFVYRDRSLVEMFYIDERTVLNQRLFGENVINVTYTAREVLNISIRDYIVYNANKYYINTPPVVLKKSSNNYEYTMVFESEYYNISKAQYMLSRDGELDGEFDLVGNASDFIDLLITNLNRVSSGWSAGTIDATNKDEYKLMHFSAENCSQVMMRLSEEYDAEFYFDRKEISFTDEVGSSIALTLQYKTGLFNFTRTNVSDKNIITRLYPLGSKRNIELSSYEFTRLRPTQVAGEYYLDQNIDTYGIIEYTKIFEDIYPTRTGTIDSVGGILEFTDDDIDFNLKDYLLSGIPAKVHFQTGQCAGYEFEISDFVWNDPGGDFTIIATSDRQDFDMPNDTLKPAVTDTYKLLDIKLPPSYITTAEDDLRDAGIDYLDDNSDARVSYNLNPDWKFLKTNNIEIKIGDFIRVLDTDLGINILTRVVRLTKQLINQYKYTLELSDNYEVQLIQRLYSDDEKIQRKLIFEDTGNILAHRRNWRTTEELRTVIFDTDDYFDTGNIRPLSIETSMLSVGNKSGQFMLKDLIVEPNYTGDESKFHASAGYLTHLTIDPAAIRSWILYANDETGLTDGTVYYIYAKCNKTDYTSINNMVIADSTARQVDADATYYYFLIGVLHSVDSGHRAISFVYGQTTINGAFIKTGKIESSDGNNYIDLDNNSFYMGDGSNKFIEWDGSALTVQGLIRTASSGKRIVLNNADNKISLFIGAGAGTEVLTIDDTIIGAFSGIGMNNANGCIVNLYKSAFEASYIRHDNIYCSSASDENVIYGQQTTNTSTDSKAVFNAVHATGTTGKLFVGQLAAATVFSVDTSGNIVCTGTVDGVDIAARDHAEAHAHAMNDLSDVTAPSPNSGDILVWQVGGYWLAQAP